MIFLFPYAIRVQILCLVSINKLNSRAATTTCYALFIIQFHINAMGESCLPLLLAALYNGICYLHQNGATLFSLPIVIHLSYCLIRKYKRVKLCTVQPAEGKVCLCLYLADVCNFGRFFSSLQIEKYDSMSVRQIRSNYVSLRDKDRKLGPVDRNCQSNGVVTSLHGCAELIKLHY